jgi:drug/metabolite transporter (DMT)-like permease
MTTANSSNRTKKTTLSMGAAKWLVLLLTAAMLGSAFLFAKVAVREVPPLTIAAVRAGFAVPVVWVFMRLNGLRLPAPGAAWRPLILIGLLAGAIPFAAIALGQLYITSGLGGILFATIPLYSVVLTPIIVREEGFSPRQLVAAGVGLVGVIIVIGPNALAGLNQHLFGTAVTLAAALAYALGTMLARRQTDTPPTAIAAGQLLSATLILVPVALIIDQPWTLSPGIEALASLAALAVFSTAIPMVLLFWLVRNAGAINASLVTLFIPLVAIGLGAALLGEQLPWQGFVGLALILLSAVSIARQSSAGARSS